MTITKKQIISVVLLLALVFSLPVAVYLTRKMQDVRPRALQGKANFLLSTDSITSTVGKNIDVLVTLQTTDPVLKISGVDFLLLYDKNRLDVGNIVPNIITVDPRAPFTDAPIVTSGGSFDENFNFVRVAQIARRTDADLPKGTFQLAKITFRGRGTGSATIKFPDEDKYLEVVGTGTSDIFQNIVPSATPTPTATPVPPTTTPSCVADVSCGNWTVCTAQPCGSGTQSRTCVDSCGKARIDSRSCKGPGELQTCPADMKAGYCNRVAGCIGEGWCCDDNPHGCYGWGGRAEGWAYGTGLYCPGPKQCCRGY